MTHTEVEGNLSFNNTFNGIGLVNADNNEIEGNDTSFNGFDGINVGSDPNDPNAVPGTATGNVIDDNEATAQRPGRHLPGIDGHRQHA